MLLMLILSLFMQVDLWQKAAIGDIEKILNVQVISMPITTLSANTWFCDPVNGKLSNSGKTPSEAWPALQKIEEAGYFDLLGPGDTVWLLSGNHGGIDIRDYHWDMPVNFAAPYGQIAGLYQFFTTNCEGVALYNLWITAEIAPPGYVNNKGLIGCQSTGNNKAGNFFLQSCRIFSYWDSSQWSQNDWLTKPFAAIYSYGTNNILVKNCFIWNVSSGIQLTGNGQVAKNNWVDNFTQDAFFQSGNNNIFDHNLITDLYDYSDYHNDAIQTYPFANNLTITNNVIVATTDFNRGNIENPHLQGIFANADIDGAYIVNNWIMSDTEHGIYFPAAINITCVNNTCWGLTYPNAHRGCPIQLSNIGGLFIQNNNISNFFSSEEGLNNLVVLNPFEVWVDPTTMLGYRLLPDGLATDTGTFDNAPLLDFEFDSRPSGPGIDIGADEFDGSFGRNDDWVFDFVAHWWWQFTPKPGDQNPDPRKQDK